MHAINPVETDISDRVLVWFTLEEVNEARFSGREAEAVLRRDGTSRNWGKTSVES